MKTGRYQLRRAAGNFWLLDMEQSGRKGLNPLPLNESGALIWQRLQEGDDPGQAAQLLAQEYGLEPDEAAEDVRQFIYQLKRQGIEC